MQFNFYFLLIIFLFLSLVSGFQLLSNSYGELNNKKLETSDTIIADSKFDPITVIPMPFDSTKQIEKESILNEATTEEKQSLLINELLNDENKQVNSENKISTQQIATQFTVETWVNPSYNPHPQALIDVQKVIFICEGDNCASSINTPQQSIKKIVVHGKDPYSAYCAEPVISPCEYFPIEGFNIGQHSNQLFGSIINKGSPTDLSSNFYLITFQYDGTDLFFKADNYIACDFNLNNCDQHYATGGAFTKMVLESRIQQDIDDDGIPDDVELNGIRDANGTLITDMKNLGSDPCRKTIAVEIDYMEDLSPGGHSHRPRADSVQDAKDMFNNAPGYPAVNPCPYTGFPTRNSGINLIVEIDQRLAEEPLISAFPYLDNIKTTHFNEAKSPYFHYNIWGHLYQEYLGSAGYAERPGNDFLVTLGSGVNQVGDRLQQASTFAHELGHNLNLTHGGSDLDEEVNCKPNYLSVMNYIFAFGLTSTSGGTTTTTIDYSREVLPLLNESRLLENRGISDGQFITYWNDGNGITRSGLGNLALDWNGNLNIDTSPVSANLNQITENGCDSPELDLLNGFNDWNNILFKFTNHKNFEDGIHLNIPKELTSEEIKELEQELKEASSANITIAKAVEGYKNPGGELKYAISIENLGGADAKNITIKDTLPPNVYYNSQININLEPKPSQIIKNNDGSTTLIWNFDLLKGKEIKKIEYSVILSLLLEDKQIIKNNLTIEEYSDIFNKKYPSHSTSLTTKISSITPTLDPKPRGFWIHHIDSISSQVLSRIQATDKMFDGADGTLPDDILSLSEVEQSLYHDDGKQPSKLIAQLLTTYLNLATYKISGETPIYFHIAQELGIKNVKDAILYAKDVLNNPPNNQNIKEYKYATLILIEINSNKSYQHYYPPQEQSQNSYYYPPQEQSQNSYYYPPQEQSQNSYYYPPQEQSQNSYY
jgi:uncharacterized repeat protein (TIGR01451 family)